MGIPAFARGPTAANAIEWNTHKLGRVMRPRQQSPVTFKTRGFFFTMVVGGGRKHKYLCSFLFEVKSSERGLVCRELFYFSKINVEFNENSSFVLPCARDNKKVLESVLT